MNNVTNNTNEIKGDIGPTGPKGDLNLIGIKGSLNPIGPEMPLNCDPPLSYNSFIESYLPPEKINNRVIDICSTLNNELPFALHNYYEKCFKSSKNSIPDEIFTLNFYNASQFDIAVIQSLKTIGMSSFWKIEYKPSLNNNLNEIDYKINFFLTQYKYIPISTESNINPPRSYDNFLTEKYKNLFINAKAREIINNLNLNLKLEEHYERVAHDSSYQDYYFGFNLPAPLVYSETDQEYDVSYEIRNKIITILESKGWRVEKSFNNHPLSPLNDISVLIAKY